MMDPFLHSLLTRGQRPSKQATVDRWLNLGASRHDSRFCIGKWLAGNDGVETNGHYLNGFYGDYYWNPFLHS